MGSEQIIVRTVGELIHILSGFKHDQPLGKPVVVEHHLIQDRYETVSIYEKAS